MAVADEPMAVADEESLEGSGGEIEEVVSAGC